MENPSPWTFIYGGARNRSKTKTHHFAMKTTVFLMSVLVIAAANAQTTTTPTATRQTGPAGTIAPQAPGLPASPQSAGLPGFNPQNPILSSSTFPPGAPTNFLNLSELGTNFSDANLAGALQNLQGAIAQALPVLAAFNNNFEFGPGFGTNGLAGLGTNQMNTAGNAAALNRGTTGTLLSQNLSGNAGQNLSVSAATPTAPAIASPTTTIPGTTASNRGLATLANQSTPGIAAGGPASQSNFPVGNAQVAAAKALVILQADIERSWQLLQLLNGGTVMGTNSFSSLNNQFTGQFTNSPINQTRTTLSPTGR